MDAPSEVANGTTGADATWTGRPQAERAGSERIKPRSTAFKVVSRDSSTPLRWAQNDGYANPVLRADKSLPVSAPVLADRNFFERSRRH